MPRITEPYINSKDEKTHHKKQSIYPSPRFIIITTFILASHILALSACRQSDPQPAPPQNSASITPETVNNFWTTIAQPYRGITLNGISEDSPPSLYVRDVLAPQFSELTGINVELKISNNAEIEQIIESRTDQQYDFTYIEQDVIYGYLERSRLVNLSQLLDDNPALAAPEFDTEDFTDFINAFVDPSTGDLYGMPIEAFIKVYLYRTDLFADPAIQTAFEEQYYYPLSPAVTLEQYRDIAQFFTAYGEEKGMELWGTTLQATTADSASFYEFFETIAPSFGLYNWGIDLDTRRATQAHGGQLDSAAAVDALSYWIDLLDYAPPNATQSNWNDVATTFAAGRVAQGWVYGEYFSWIATDPARSSVVSQVGVALPPTAPGVMDDATIGTGYLGYYDGAAFGIPINSQNKAAALLWLQYLAQSSVQPEWATQSGRVVHLSTFDNPLVQAQDRRLNGYYTLMKKQGPLFAGAPPFPFHAQARDVIAPFIHAAIRKEMTPRDALTAAATAVDKELIRLGYIVP